MLFSAGAGQVIIRGQFVVDLAKKAPVNRGFLDKDCWDFSLYGTAALAFATFAFFTLVFTFFVALVTAT